MIKSYPLLKPLTDKLMKEVRAYGILEVSLVDGFLQGQS